MRSVALVLVLAGGGLTLFAAGWAAYRSMRTLRRLEAKVEAVRAASARKVERDRQTNESDQRAAREVLPDVLREREERSEAEFSRDLSAALGSDPDAPPHWTWTDMLIVPEHTALAIARDQVSSLRGPAATVAVGIVTSTAGSVVALYIS